MRTLVVHAETNSWSGTYQDCDVQGTSRSCKNYIAVLPDSDQFQAYEGSFSARFKGHGGFFGGGGGRLHVNACLTQTGQMWTGSCWRICALDVDDGWGRCDGFGAIEEDPNPDFNYWTVGVWISDGKLLDPVLGIKGRRVSIDSFNVPSSVNSGETFFVSWNTDKAFNGAFMFIDGPVNRDDTDVSQSGSMEMTATGSGTIYMTLKACGPGGSGPACVETGRTISVMNIETPAGPDRQNHLECGNNTCTLVAGPGADQCSPEGSFCGGLPPPPSPPPSPSSFRNACTNDGACVRVRGSGANQCSDPGNPDSQNCAQPAPTCSSFISSPQKLVYPPAKSATLSWTCAKAHLGCKIRDDNPDAPDIGDVPQSGSRGTPSLSKTTEYVLQCQGRGGVSPEYRLPLGALRVYQLTGGKIREVAP